MKNVAIILATLCSAGCVPISCEDRSGATRSTAPKNQAMETKRVPDGAVPVGGVPAGKEEMKHVRAVVICWVGPSDRPPPQTVLGIDQASIKSAAEWIGARGLAPMGVSEVVTPGDGLACVAKSTPAAMAEHATAYLEVSAWDGAAGKPVRLDGAGSKAFLIAAVACVGETSPAGGYLKSLQTILANATK